MNEDALSSANTLSSPEIGPLLLSVCAGLLAMTEAMSRLSATITDLLAQNAQLIDLAMADRDETDDMPQPLNARPS